MNVVDIVLILLLLWAVVKGFRDGIILQLGSLIGLFLGLWLAYRFAPRVGVMLGLPEGWAYAGGFAVTALLVVLGIYILGWLMRGLFRMTGLGIVDHMGGAVLSAAKMFLVAGLAIYMINIFGLPEGKFRTRVEESLLYQPLQTGAQATLPYLVILKDTLFEDEKIEKQLKPLPAYDLIRRLHRQEAATDEYGVQRDSLSVMPDGL